MHIGPYVVCTWSADNVAILRMLIGYTHPRVKNWLNCGIRNLARSVLFLFFCFFCFFVFVWSIFHFHFCVFFLVGSVLRRYAASHGARISESRKQIANTSPEACAISCANEGSFICRSFDYEKNAGKCYLSDKSSATKKVTVDTSNTFDYYQISKC